MPKLSKSSSVVKIVFSSQYCQRLSTSSTLTTMSKIVQNCITCCIYCFHIFNENKKIKKTFGEVAREVRNGWATEWKNSPNIWTHLGKKPNFCSIIEMLRNHLNTPEEKNLLFANYSKYSLCIWRRKTWAKTWIMFNFWTRPRIIFKMDLGKKKSQILWDILETDLNILSPYLIFVHFGTPLHYLGL